MRPVEFSVAIIAGGAGRRLGGVVKALVELDGETVLSRLEALAPDRPLFVVTNHDAFPGLRSVPDVVQGKGAPGGVVTAMLAATTEWVLVVAGDMPFLRRAHVEALVRAASPELDVVVATRGDRLEPLFALYRCALAATWEPLLDDDPSLRSLIARARWSGVSFDPAVLESLNTPEDLARAGARLPR